MFFSNYNKIKRVEKNVEFWHEYGRNLLHFRKLGALNVFSEKNSVFWRAAWLDKYGEKTNMAWRSRRAPRYLHSHEKCLPHKISHIIVRTLVEPSFLQGCLPASFWRSIYHTPSSFPVKWNSNTPLTSLTSCLLHKLFMISKIPSTPSALFPCGTVSAVFWASIIFLASEPSTSKKKSGNSLLPVNVMKGG